jgi:hypothetical protein
VVDAPINLEAVVVGIAEFDRQLTAGAPTALEIEGSFCSSS